jgi:beta-N-acetylhexosaminidase
VELVPFRAAIRAGAPAVMTTHIMFPTLDRELPATLSRPILTELLREELGFEGLVVTDCLEMKGIADHWGPEEAGVLVLEAGADMLLICHTQETQARMHAAVCAAVRSGRLSEGRLHESLARVRRARELTESARSRAGHPEIVSATAYRELEARVTEASLTLLGDAPFRGWTRSEPVVVSGAEVVASALAAVLAESGLQAEAVPSTGLDRLASAAQLIWAALPTEPFSDGRPTPEIASLLARHRRALVIAAREPYCLEHYPAEVPRLAAWGAQPPHLHALARWLAARMEGGRV